MRKAFGTVLLTISSVFVCGLLLAHAQTQETPPAAEDRERLLATGKKIFVERCARCHNESGDKPLSSGPPLNERGLSDVDIARTVAGRLKSSPDEQKRGVALYIGSFMKKK